MIVDTSVLVAILRDEPDAAIYAQAIEDASMCRISAAGFVEAAIVIDGSRDVVSRRRFDDLLRMARITIEPVTENRRGSHVRRTAITAAAAAIRRKRRPTP